MKKFIVITAVFFALLTATAGATAAVAPSDFRAVWVSSVINLDFPSKPGLSPDALKSEIDSIVRGAKAVGYNALILQVRPCADALYKSELFPWSEYLTGTRGKAPADGFDPLKYWVERAHAEGLQLHAWINPFRITMGTVSKPDTDVNALAESHPARKNPSWAIAYKDGRLYFDPGNPEVRRLVVSGAVELVKNYAVDGVHFDDYFYPGADFNDETSYKKYGADYASKAEWRRSNTDALIKDVSDAIAKASPDTLFGVSPIGIWANKANNALGSDTKGNESYYAQYADTRKWVKSEWVDYIAPQIYWAIGYEPADYAKLVPWWSDAVKGTKVKLYIGTAIYRAYEDKNPSGAWYGADEIARQAGFNAAFPEVSGVIHFRYSFLNANGGLADTVTAVFGAGDNAAVPVSVTDPGGITLNTPNKGKLYVGRPSKDITAEYDKYFILGASDPAKPLKLGGEEVPGRSADGYFGVLVTLKTGANKFTFTQDGQTAVSVTITRKTAAVKQPVPADKAAVTDMFPNAGIERRAAGEKITLSCTAPIGAEVSVKIGETTVKMNPKTTTLPYNNGKIYTTSFTCEYTFPPTGKTDTAIDLGKAQYTMTYKSAKSSYSSAHGLVLLTPNAPVYAEITAGAAWVYPDKTTTGGPKGELCKGFRDYVAATGGAWVKLKNSGWVQSGDVVVKQTGDAPVTAAKSAVYSVGNKIDRLTVNTAAITSAFVTELDDGVSIRFAGVKNKPALSLPKNALFARAELNADDGGLTVILRGGEDCDGYYVTSDAAGITVNLKRRPKADPSGAKPLAGIKIVLDPGHGGGESGAIGCLGANVREADVNLVTAKKLRVLLERMGAVVVMTREGDQTVSLEARTMISRAARPDLTISIHANSLDENVDASNTSGLETFYRNKYGKRLSDLLYTNANAELGLKKRASKQSNLYVNRPWWCPSVLIETGFMNNPADFSRITGAAGTDAMAYSFAGSVAEYFG